MTTNTAAASLPASSRIIGHPMHSVALTHARQEAREREAELRALYGDALVDHAIENEWTEAEIVAAGEADRDDDLRARGGE